MNTASCAYVRHLDFDTDPSTGDVVARVTLVRIPPWRTNLDVQPSVADLPADLRDALKRWLA